MGYSIEEELNVYGDRISDIHIKDRTQEGKSVKLGTGNANIPGFFELLDKYNYHGPYIMQAYRDEEGITIFKEQFEWVKPFLEIKG
jgi:sugar phosphate isomerase/epimerase